jgi:hypothetical protein
MTEQTEQTNTPTDLTDKPSGFVIDVIAPEKVGPKPVEVPADVATSLGEFAAYLTEHPAARGAHSFATEADVNVFPASSEVLGIAERVDVPADPAVRRCAARVHHEERHPGACRDPRHGWGD